MNSAELGRRLKEARLAKKMTQSEVVGDFITRNMLSQIESGVATPSIKTLEYLASVLEISMSSLIPEDDVRSSGSSEAFSIVEAKRAISEENYQKALELLESGSDCYSDEYSALRSIACLELAKQASSNGELQNAVNYAKKAQEYAQAGLYANNERAEESMHLMNKSAKLLSDYYAALITE